MSNSTRARLQAVGYFFLIGFLSAVYDAATAVGPFDWHHVLGPAAIGGLGSALLYLKQSPREPWSYGERFDKALKDAAADGVVHGVQEAVTAVVDATQVAAADAKADSKAIIEERKP